MRIPLHRRDARDTVREALDEEKVSFLGVSYGTMLAQSYAEILPERVRRMVLDGGGGPVPLWRQLAEADALAVEDGIKQFDAGRIRICKQSAQAHPTAPGVPGDRRRTGLKAGLTASRKYREGPGAEGGA